MDGLVTLFYVALLTNRALTIMPRYGLPFEWVFDSPFINWTYDERAVAGLPEKHLDLKWGESWPVETDPLVGESLALVKALKFENLTGMFGDVPSLYVGAGVPLFDLLFHNPYHKRQLYDWGLTPETAAGCALRYLFTPSTRLRSRFDDEFEQLSDRNALKIGFHLRFGDALAFNLSGDDALDTGAYDFIFRCAEDIEHRFGHPGQRKLWFVISDRPSFRQYAKERYGAKVVTDTNYTFFLYSVSRGDAAAALHSFETVVADYWLYSLTDYQLMLNLARLSSFSNGGAAASLHWTSAIDINLLDYKNKLQRGCLPGLHRAHENWGDPWLR